MSRPGARSIDDFCADTGIGRTTLYGLIKAKRLVVRKVGARTVILDRDAETFLNSLPTAGDAKKLGRCKQARG